MTALSPRLLAKLGALVVHAQEIEPGTPAAEFDMAAIKGLAADPDVTAWLATVDPVLLPERRA